MSLNISFTYAHEDVIAEFSSMVDISEEELRRLSKDQLVTLAELYSQTLFKELNSLNVQCYLELVQNQKNLALHIMAEEEANKRCRKIMKSRSAKIMKKRNSRIMKNKKRRRR